MKEATVIYPHQLFETHPAIKTGRVIYLVEEPLFLTEFPIHTQKLLLHRLSMQAYKAKLESDGFEVSYLSILDIPNTEEVFEKLNTDNVTHLHIVDTTDVWLEKRIATAVGKHAFTISRYESPLFILTKEEAVERFQKSNKHMAKFYKKLRTDKNILLADDGEPVGGKWSFDEENRKKIPKGKDVPLDMPVQKNEAIDKALTWLESITAEHYGEPSVWVPWTHAGAADYLQEFVEDRLHSFGTYEDALTEQGSRLFHSTISPLLNIGLLTPQQVLNVVIEHGTKNDIGLNNIEGFVRQVLGWREFIRASYECDGTKMRTKNFWKHTKSLPSSFWDGTTQIVPIDISILKALQYGYNHHIERLMVLGNFMLLSKIHPDEVYRWFMAMYVDAYDWVMVPNVYGMSQFADGGIFATKPYISGSNYLKKMSDYPTGEWEEVWTALYWNFIDEHKEFFLSNHRLSMMPRLLEKMDTEKKKRISEVASNYLAK